MWSATRISSWSPTFLIYVNDAFQAVHKSKIIMFADDTDLFYAGPSSKSVTDTLSMESGLLAKWFWEK